MTDAGFFRGTSSEQDNRFSDKEKKLLKQMKFADNLSTKIEMNKIKIDVLKPWIGKRISELLGMEDDVVADFVTNQLEAEKNPDARKIQINLTGFLNGKNARIFIGELWDMLISAQESPSGIPASMVEAKKEEIRKRTEEQERINESLKRTVSRFTEKIKDDRDSPPNRRDRSSSRDRDSKRTTKTGDADDKSHDESAPKRNYRSRRSASASPEPTNKRNKSRSRSGSRDRRDNRDRQSNRRAPPFRPTFDNSRGDMRDRRGGPGGPDRFGRDRPRRSSRSPRPNRRSRSRSRSPQQRRPRSRSPPYRGSGGSKPSSPPRVRRRSPLYESRNNRNDSNYRDEPVTADRDRLRGRDDRRRNSPTLKNKETTDKSGDGSKDKDNKKDRKNSKSDDLAKDGDSASPSSNGSLSSPENGVSNKSGSTNKKKNSSTEDSEKSDNGDESKKKDKKDKKKKKEKKHKKHKKHSKKIKKTKDKQKSSSEEGESDEDAVDGKGKERNEQNGNTVVLLPNEKIAQSFRKLVESEDPTTEDLETRLREKALSSMMKANMNR